MWYETYKFFKRIYVACCSFIVHKKISEKAVNLSNFLWLQHIFLGLGSYLWKINLSILWSHTIKNFQVKCGQCDSIIFPETFSLGRSTYQSDLPFVTTGFFWQAVESIQRFIIELDGIQCLFVRWSDKQQRRGEIISNFI